jgi:hypothetical protein
MSSPSSVIRPERTGSSPTAARSSEVSEIINSIRQVRDVTVLERIADSLGMPRPFRVQAVHSHGP